VSLPLKPPVLPQLARPRASLPEGDGWTYEPKWDGFRTIAFVDGGECYLQSRNGKPMTRYFPEVRFPEGSYVLDGELVIAGEDGRQEFELLGQRIHPAASRVAMLADKTPATFIAFDVLARDGEVLLERSLGERRAALEGLAGESVELTPWTEDVEGARPWLQTAEGVIAKELACPYKPGERTGMVKVKRVRTIDCVVMGWRPGKAEGTVGALILGLYDADGRLREVGHSSGFKAAEKKSLVDELRPYETGERGSGEPSRWTHGRELAWVMLRPELVVEVTFDHVSGGRIRHGAKVQRWREDKPPAECGIEQLQA
jgi:ATP-dependent DNA ligase